MMVYGYNIFYKEIQSIDTFPIQFLEEQYSIVTVQYIYYKAVYIYMSVDDCCSPS